MSAKLREVASSAMSTSSSSDEEREHYSTPQLLASDGEGSRPCSRSASPLQRNRRLPARDAVGTALQSTLEDLIQRDLLDTSVAVELANSREARQKMEDLLPIHYYSWKLKDVEAALVYTLLHIFVLLGQYTETVTERSANEEYISQLKDRVAQLEDTLQELGRDKRGNGETCTSSEVSRLRRENAELRRERAKLQASQHELFQINDAWSRDYHSLTQKIEALTSGNWTNGDTEQQHLTNGEQHQKHEQAPPRTPTHPPSLIAHSSHLTHSQQQQSQTTWCAACSSLQEQVAELNRQVKELGRGKRDLEKFLEQEERNSKQKDMIIKTLDAENQAVQMQIQEIGDLQAAAHLKEDFRKIELQMRQKEKQYQDVVSSKIQLQQKVDKLKQAFMTIFGVPSSSVRRHTSSVHRHDCRVHQYMSEPLPPPPTPPGLIARGNHFGSLVEKDRKQRMLYDEQVTGFERTTPTNMSLPTDTRSWPQVTKRAPHRPNTLIPKTNGLSQKQGDTRYGRGRYMACPGCSKPFDIEGEEGFSDMFEHISYCDSTQ